MAEGVKRASVRPAAAVWGSKTSRGVAQASSSSWRCEVSRNLNLTTPTSFTFETHQPTPRVFSFLYNFFPFYLHLSSFISPKKTRTHQGHGWTPACWGKKLSFHPYHRPSRKWGGQLLPVGCGWPADSASCFELLLLPHAERRRKRPGWDEMS